MTEIKDEGKMYVLHPGYVKSKDGDVHYIGFSKLVRLYNLPVGKCINNDWSDRGLFRGERYIHLYPSETGDYKL